MNELPSCSECNSRKLFPDKSGSVIELPSMPGYVCRDGDGMKHLP